MFKNIYRHTLRNLLKYPVYSFLNLGGLALGLASSFLLLVYVQRELTYETHFENADRIYRVATDFYNMGGFAGSQEILTGYLQTQCKDVEVATRMDRAYQEQPVEVKGHTYMETGVYTIDSTFFDVFSYNFVEGNANQPYLTDQEVILTETIAQKYFGEQPAWGKTIKYGKEKKEYRVAGVIRAQNSRSHLKPSLLFSIYPDLSGSTNWNSSTVYNYVKLTPSGTKEGLANSLESIRKSTVYPAVKFEGTYDEWVTSNNVVQFFIQPLPDIYLYSDYKFEVSPGGNPQQVFILGIVGLFLIFLGGINYINLTTARSAIRAKEVGVKKTLGAPKKALVFQFLGESIGFSVIAMVIGLGLSEALLRVFEKIAGISLLDSLVFNSTQLLYFILFSILVGTLAGLYPSFYLTKFRPAKVLKGSYKVRGNKGLRGGLVVFQFAIAIGLMIASWVVFQQLQFMNNKDLGMKKEGVLIVDGIRSLGNNLGAFRDKLETYNQVEETSLCYRTPAGKSVWMYTYQTDEMDESKTIQTFPADDQYISALGMRLVEGRNFDNQRGTDSMAVILNEAAAKELGIQKDPIGKETNPGQVVVGVIENFHFQSLRESISPVVIQYSPNKGSELAVRLSGNKVSSFLGDLQSLWAEFSPEDPLQYHFLDENFAQLLAKERTLSRAVSFFTILAIIIACLGLFGLAVFTAESRTKEIGIRKVLGASITDIIGLLSSDFVKLILVAMVIGIPVSWWLMARWLQDFAFRIDIHWWMIVGPCVLALMIALITVSSQAFKAALKNPVDSLRYE